MLLLTSAAFLHDRGDQALYREQTTHGQSMAEEVAAGNAPFALVFYSSWDCSGKEAFVFSDHNETKCQSCFDTCNKRWNDDSGDLHGNVASFRFGFANSNSVVVGKKPRGELQLFEQCIGTYEYQEQGFVGSVHANALECVDIRSVRVSHVKFKVNLPGEEGSAEVDLQNSVSNVRDFRVVYSCESSDYFGWQVITNYHAFLKSEQKNAAYTRLLTASRADDLAETIPTFTASRHPESRRYSPINKPDSIHKWMSSTPMDTIEDVVVVIDPDNWLIKDLSPWASKVKKGFPIAQSAWFFGSNVVDEIWQLVCEQNCDRVKTDHVAVPVFIHKQDLAQVAPLWTHYTLKVRKLYDSDSEFKAKYERYQVVTWSVEMIGYVYAAAHVGLVHTIERHLQIRDVDSRLPETLTNVIPMIHMGRAWFPDDYEPGRKWWHTEGKDFKRFGSQVWCKCNYTAGEIVPWPIPSERMDFVSRHTLTLLHEAKERFPLPQNTMFRKPGSSSWHQSFP